MLSLVFSKWLCPRSPFFSLWKSALSAERNWTLCLPYQGRPRLGLNPDSSSLACSFRIPIQSFKKNLRKSLMSGSLIGTPPPQVYHHMSGFTLGGKEWFWRGNSPLSCNTLSLNLELVKFKPWHCELEDQDPWCYFELGLWSSLNCGLLVFKKWLHSLFGRGSLWKTSEIFKLLKQKGLDKDKDDRYYFIH